MGFKLVLFGTVAVLIQSISGQCTRNIGNINGPGRFGPTYPTFPNSLGPARPGPCASSTGGSFAVTSASPASPTGVSVLAENLAIEGPLSVGGNLPFLGTVGIEGAMPNAGAGAVSYGCGNGNVGIVGENSAGIPGPYGLAGSPIGLAGSPIGLAGSPVGLAGSPIGLAGSPIGLAGSPRPIGSPFAPNPLSPGVGYGATGSFGSLNSPVGPGSVGLSRPLGPSPGSPFLGTSFGQGLGFSGFNGLRQ